MEQSVKSVLRARTANATFLKERFENKMESRMTAKRGGGG